MNKKLFIKELEKQTGYNEEKCYLINSIIEDTFIIGKKNKEKMKEKFQTQLNITENKADELYIQVMNIIGSELKNKLKHPFKNQD